MTVNLNSKVSSYSDPLSPLFAQEVLDTETDLSLNCTLGNLQRLIDLYKTATEYYESVCNPRHLHFQQKLRTLFTRRDVLKLLNYQPSSNASKGVELPIQRKAEKTIKIHYNTMGSTFRKLRDNIQSQSKSLTYRLALRCQKSITPESDVCGGTPFTQFESEIEGIIEKCIQEKERVKKYIQNNYFTQIENLKSSEENEHCIRSLESKMDEEIRTEYSQIDSQKKRALAFIRKNTIG